MPEETDKGALKRVHIIVDGRVQGIGFRFWAMEKARELELKGWVKNLLDSSVEIVAEGPTSAVEKFVAKIRHGPAQGYISNVIVENEIPTGEFFGFEIMY